MKMDIEISNSLKGSRLISLNSHPIWSKCSFFAANPTQKTSKSKYFLHPNQPFRSWYIKLCIQQGKGKSVMEIIYSDTFSESSKFHLELVEGSNEQKKEYLANQLKYWKNVAQENEKVLEQCDSENKQRMEQCDMLIEQLKEEKQELLLRSEKEMYNATFKLKEEISRLKEKHLEELQKAQSRIDEERKHLEDKYQIQSKALNQKLEDLMVQNKDLMSSKFSLESDVRELTTRTSQLENEKKSYLEEITKLREENRTLDTLKFEQEKRIRELETKVTLNEELMKEKGVSLKNMNDYLKEKEQQEMSKSEALTELKTKYDLLEKMHDQASAEIQKCHNYIKIYNDKYESLRKVEQKRVAAIQNFQHSLKRIDLEKKQLAETVEIRNQTILQKEETIRSIQDKLEKKEKEVESAMKQLEISQFTVESLKKEAVNRTSQADTLMNFSKSTSSGIDRTFSSDFSDRNYSSALEPTISKLDSFQNYYNTARYGSDSSISTDMLSTPEKSNAFTFSIPNISPLGTKNKSPSPPLSSSKRNLVSFEPQINKEWQ